MKPISNEEAIFLAIQEEIHESRWQALMRSEPILEAVERHAFEYPATAMNQELGPDILSQIPV